MRTSEEIYHRIRWDPRFDPSRFVLGVGQRDADPKRVALPAFAPGGEVPWHRVLFVEADGELVWDRATGLDRVDTCEAGRVRVPRRLRPPFWTARTPYAWGPARWSPAVLHGPAAFYGPAAGHGAAGHAAARVLTWNTLWDRYDSDRIDTARRRPLLLAALEEADADVIALQEVEPALLVMLMSAPWVRAGYSLGIDPYGPDVEDDGLLLLSRWPVREAARHELGRHKSVAAIVVDTAAGPLTVAVTHLSSDHSSDGAGRRRAELSVIAEGLAGVDGDLVLVGDFNDGTETPASALGLRDAWTEAYGTDQTPTFDPVVNPLAALASLSGQAARLDRILLRGRPRVIAAALRGDTPTPDGLYISDHYGVEAVVGLTEGDGGPPDGVLDGVLDWPPHVNLLFGFVPESEFEAAAPLLAAAAAEVEPFTARLDGVRTFRHRDHSTVWLDPAAGDPAPWSRLRHALERRFPRCEGRPEGFTPHLTLGRTDDTIRVNDTIRVDGMTALVGEVMLLSRRADEPMRPRARITLGTGEIHWPPEPATSLQEPAIGVASPASGEAQSTTGVTRRRSAATAQQDDVAGRVIRRLEEALRPGVVSVAGSRRMGCALPDADLDLVAALPGETDMTKVEAQVRAALPEVSRLRQVIGARVPGLRFRTAELDVDLTVVPTGPLSPEQAVDRRAELGEAAAIALSAVSDADAVRAAAGHRHDGFATLARQVKTWARARGLDSAPFGGLPGLAWAIMAACTVRDSGDLLGDFFSTWAAWNWHDPIALSPALPQPAPITVLTPSAPVRNCARQITPGTLDRLTHELYRAWELTENNRLAELSAPPPLHRRHAAWAVLTVHASRPEELDATLGRVRGRMLELLAALEEAGMADVHAWPRPFETGPRTVRYAIGLGRAPSPAGRLGEIADRWSRGLPGVTVERAECGAVPTLR
ncbi:poly(A) polymerase [Nonomuraea sp. NPDC049695]|uniref:poly(A) polymerase n=1 Tax=Nonomuraea sp. NPDC049695 TaxID=3154734 RepID=UPI0034408712